MLANQGPATAQTLGQIKAVQDQARDLEQDAALEKWKGERLAELLQQMRSDPLVLPATVPPNLTARPAVAYLQEGTALYSGPEASNATPIGQIAAPMPALRVANAGPMLLVWVPGAGFAFVLERFAEVYE